MAVHAERRGRGRAEIAQVEQGRVVTQSAVGEKFPVERRDLLAQERAGGEGAVFIFAGEIVVIPGFAQRHAVVDWLPNRDRRSPNPRHLKSRAQLARRVEAIVIGEIEREERLVLHLVVEK